MIRDTSGQDRVLTKPAMARRRRLSVAVAVIGVVLGFGYVARGWLSSQRSIDRSRIRIAQVHRGTLVRDVVADGRVVAANSPTLYAIAAGTVEFRVRSGDTVTRGQVVATVASPDLASRLVQEQATLAGLSTGVGRAQLDIEHGRANADKLVAQADIDRQTAQREVDVDRAPFAKGVIAELELRRAEDLLEKAAIAPKHARRSKPGSARRSWRSISGRSSRASGASKRSSTISSASSPRSRSSRRSTARSASCWSRSARRSPRTRP